MPSNPEPTEGTFKETAENLNVRENVQGSLTAPEPTQPLTEERLAAIRGRFKEVINDRKHKVSLRATDMYDLLSEVDRLRSENAAWALSRAAAEPVHSVQLGRGDTACGVAMPGVLPWDAARLDFSSPTLTTRPERATCPECVAALDQSGEGQANATE